jgi:hypothetical protein
MFSRMNPAIQGPRFLLAPLLLLFIGASIVQAQEETAKIYGSVTDPEGERLPGVAIALDGPGAEQIQISDKAGNFRFLDLDPGQWSLEASLDGFSTIAVTRIDTRAGRSVTLAIELPREVQEVITVTSESPLLDERKVSRGSILSQLDLEVLPTARDPWAVLNQAPGVLLDRVNVGGNESAQQSVFVAPGAEDADNNYLRDGVEITDSWASANSPTYYDFDQFAQFELSVGGTEITKLTPGVSINMVTKRGTNQFRGTSRFLLTDASGYFGILEQGEPRLDESELGEGQDEAVTGNRTDRIREYGFDAGGPALRDRVWLWAAWGVTETRIFAANGQPQEFRLENVALKLDAQPTSANSLLASWSTGNKTAAARGAGPTRSDAASWSQRGPTDIWKLEDTHIFSTAWFLSASWSEVDGGFALAAKGGVGPDAPEVLLDSDGVWKQNYFSSRDERPSRILQADGNYFTSGGRVSHELEFGARYRSFDYVSTLVWPGRQLIHYAGNNFGDLPDELDFFDAARNGEAPGALETYSCWLQDTISVGDWTLSAGLRWDLQEAENGPARAAPNPAFPDILPGLEYPGDDAGGFDWQTVSPRLGATHALGDERMTLLRASYSRFAQQLNGNYPRFVNPVGWAYAYFYFFDSNDNNIWDGPDVDGDPVFYGGLGYDPANPAAVDSPNQIDPGLDAPPTDELILAVQHSPRPEFVIGADLTYRRAGNLLEERQLIRQEDGNRRTVLDTDFRLDQTVTGQLPDGTPYAVDFYALSSALQDTGGYLLINGDRRRDYLGITISATKRLTRRWMLRGYLNYGQGEWAIPTSFYRYRDPTDAAGAIRSFSQSSQDNDGDISFGNGRSLMQSDWSFNLNGMVQVAPERPWGFNLSGNLYGRQGYPLPYYLRQAGSDGIRREADAVSASDQFRLEDLLTLDLRLEKELAATGQVALTFGLDAFNLLNANTVLRRELQLTGARPDYVNETLSPRIFRVGVRINWR